MSEKGQLCSLDHRHGIFDLEECKIAANETNSKFKDARHRPLYPKGCYYLTQNNNIYFNTDTAGQANRATRQVCKQEGKSSFYFPFTPSGFSETNLLEKSHTSLFIFQKRIFPLYVARALLWNHEQLR